MRRLLILPLVMAFSASAATPAPAWNAKSPEATLDWFSENVYGRLPPTISQAKVSFAAESPDKVMMDGAALRKLVRCTIVGPYGTNSFRIVAFLPTAAKKPVPAFLFLSNRPAVSNIDPERKVKSGFWPAEEIVARGYAAVAFYLCDVSPDCLLQARKGVFACFEDFSAEWRRLNLWGTLRAWAWGASRVMDWIETERAIDASKVAVVGHSRGGKTALLAGVTDKRFAYACVNGSGCAGAKLNRANLPKSESIASIASNFSYWFCLNYVRQANRDGEIECDQHQLLALMAPRLLAVGAASEDAWAGQEGEFAACRLASGAWEERGLKGFVEKGFPRPGEAYEEGMIGFHYEPGPHDLTPANWKRYMDFAEKHGWK